MDNVYRWGKANWGNIPRGIKAIQTRLQNLNSISPTREQITTKHQLETNLDTLLLKEELWWSQRAKSNWLQHGDKNSKYFHFKASQRHRKNTINFFQDSQGSHKTQNKDIQKVFLTYFNDIFTSSNPTNIQDAINVVANRVSPQMKDYLSQDFTATEVSFATHQLKGNAAPGPDGLNASFYQKYWNIIGGDITQTALNILNNGGSPSPYNDNYICLIP
jgi:hypothetical protein